MSDDEINEGWKFLFDGKSSSGWKSAGGKSFPRHGWEMAYLAISLGGAIGELWDQDGLLPVSYKHLTLPTNDLV